MHRPTPPRPPTRTARRAARLATLLAGVALVAGCGSSDGATTSDDRGDTGAAEGYPVSVDNCGTEVTFTEPPERVVTIKSTSTELMLALGLEDRIVGQAFQDGPVPERWADEASDIPTISDQAPGQEAVLEHEPDLVLAGWESNLAADTAGERDTLAELGVNSYVAPSACQGEAQPEQMTYDLLFEHFEEAGRILGVPEAAADLVSEQRAELAEVPRAESGTTALWWSSGTDTPFVGGGIGAPQMVMDRVGLTNVAADIDQTWSSLGWEAIVAADPDVIVLVDAEWNTAESKVADLESNPATAEMTAVQQERYLTIPFPAGEAGVRSVGAAASLADQLGGLGLLEEE